MGRYQGLEIRPRPHRFGRKGSVVEEDDPKWMDRPPRLFPPSRQPRIGLCMGDNLFRPEVIEAQSRRLYGDVILQRPIGTRLMTWVIVIIVGLAVAWVAIGKYARVETARGILVPVGGSSKIYPLHPGIVTELLVKDGQQVRAGQRLAVITVETPTSSGKIGTDQELGSLDAQENLANRQIALAEQRSTSETGRLDETIAGLRRQIMSLTEQADLQQQIVASTSQSFNDVGPAVKAGFVTKTEYERRRQAMLSARTGLSQLKQQIGSAEAQIAQTEKERMRAVLDGRNDRAGAQSTLEALRQQYGKVSREGSYSIEAPVSGRVTAVQVGIGRVVDGQMPLMVVIPEGAALRADLFVPTRAIGFIKEGQEVRLLYDAFPYQQFGSFPAHIETISRLAIAGAETDAPFKIDEPVYRVTALLDHQTVSAYGKPVPLQPGMTLVANVVLERQSFLDWILQPLHAVTNRN